MRGSRRVRWGQATLPCSRPLGRKFTTRKFPGRLGGWVRSSSTCRLTPHLITTMEGPPGASPSYTVLRSQTKEYIFRLNRYFLQEKANRGTLLPVTQATKRTADAFGISETTVKRICSRANKMCETSPQAYKPVFTSPIKNTPKKVTNLDDFDDFL